MRQRHEVEFGPFRLEPARRLLTKAGHPVPIGDRALDILLVLAAHAPAVVTPRVLLEQAWPGVFVEKSNLRVQIATLRKALGDGKDGNRYISTVTGRGYCIVAALSRLNADDTEERCPCEESEVGGEADNTGQAAPSASAVTNLSLHQAEIIGRERELAELQEWLGRRSLITLVGPGGIGKTRLAAELGWRVLADFPGGVWLVDLAPLADRAAVARATADALGVAVTNADAIVETIVAALGKARRLLIFDNCEHLIDAAATLIRTLLNRSPGVSVLATSQRDLRLAAEQIYSLTPLEVPPPGTVEIGGFSAADLFVARARAADRLFELHETNGADIGEICRHLDGLPLALEMAAARLRMFGVEGLRRGLGDRLKILKGAVDGDARHASLYTVMEWSHGLLTCFDQRVFRRLAAFPGSFSLDAAVAVAGEEGAESWDIVEALGRLIDRSLVTLERHDPPRYRLLETLRLYAGERLRTSGETEEAAERHSRHFIEVFGKAELSWEEVPDADWIAPYQPELPNLRAALDWALAEPERRQIAVALAASGSLLLHALFLIAEGRKYLDLIVPLIDRDTPRATAAHLLRHASAFCLTARDPKGLVHAERAASLYRKLDDRQNLATALSYIGGYRMNQGRLAEARTIILEAQLLLAGSFLKKRQLVILIILGSVATYMNNPAEGRRYFTQAIDLAHALKSFRESTCLSNLGLSEYALGNTERAIELTREAAGRARSAPGQRSLGHTLGNLAAYLLAIGKPSEAKPILQEMLPLVNRGNCASACCLRPFAVLEAMEGRLVEAARLIGFVDAECVRHEQPIVATERPLNDKLSGLLEAGLQPADLEAYKAEGAHWSEAEALEFAARRFSMNGRANGPSEDGEGHLSIVVPMRNSFRRRPNGIEITIDSEAAQR